MKSRRGSCPSFDGLFGPWCVYGARQCRCTNEGGPAFWVCESSMCPTAPIETGTPCEPLGLVCDPGLESNCVCLDREHTWFCCNHGQACVDNHWQIATVPLDADGE